MKKLLVLLLALLLSGGALASVGTNQASCENLKNREERSISFCYGVAHFEFLTKKRIELCNKTFKNEKVFVRCIDEAATSDIFNEEILACKKATIISKSAIKCLYAAANSVSLTSEDIRECGEETSLPGTFASCLKNRAGDL